MSQGKFVAASGIKHLSIVDENGIDTGRSVDFNPADQGFVEDMHALASKISAIHKEKEAEREAAEDGVARFDINRAEDQEMREAVDSLFGEGFSKDVFKTRLFAIVDGMTVIENFLYGLLDEIDESITSIAEVRDARVRKYTEKYSKYAKKDHA